MQDKVVNLATDRGQSEWGPTRSRATRNVLVQAAIALWRTNGYANTTVADICRAAGVSKALFYFYFPHKEDVLFEAGVLSTENAHRRARELLRKPYELSAVIGAALTSLEQTMRRNPPELIIEAVLEGYRQEHRAQAEGKTHDRISTLFLDLFKRAQADRKLPRDVDVAHLAHLAQSMVGEGARHWAAGLYGGRSYAEVVGRDIAALVSGFAAAPPAH